MPKNISHTRNVVITSKSKQDEPSFDDKMTWRMRWFLVIALTIIYVLLVIGGLIGYGVTKDLRFLIFITPTILIPFVHYLVPMDKKKHEQKNGANQV